MNPQTQSAPVTADSPPRVLALLASACLEGVLRHDYMAPARLQAAPESRARVQSKSGWRPAAKKAVQGGTPGATNSRVNELSSTEEYCLVRRARTGCVRSRERLIEHHLPLVMSIARRFDSRRVPFEDLVSEGAIGLMTAVEKFDPERGFRLSTYARWWIGQGIALAIMNHANIVRIPVHVQRHARKAARESGQTDPLTDELAENIETVDEAMALSRSYLPALDLGDDLLASIASPEEAQPLNVLWRLEQHVVLEAAVRGLSEREQFIIHARFGLDNDEPRTLESIATELGLSEERVRQILKAAVRKMRAEIGRQGYEAEG